MQGSPLYSILLLTGVLLGAAGWWRLSKSDSRLPVIYFSGLVAAFLGAKLAFLAAEGWLHGDSPDRWWIWASGKSVIGALPAGWLGVELAKKATGYRSATGDRFALLLPVPLILGRIGCLDAGCCLGIVVEDGRWPAVPVEIAFQLLILGVLVVFHWRKWFIGQHFHLYLMAYGTFRFFHEFLRDTPKPFFGFSGYQLIALGTAVAAALAFRHRKKRGVAISR
ncbi:prolipoprotein diacylglyceryl transferase [Haloferula rosea]|uniref:Prolipoprotein diacylglyceryl transferase n=1 Tax=Haloferula rosea TaxID=490093 RepID=A0A934RA66_9BACT|nr:prolipoprotein diacylglyceryl transferase family protein [Haloferula rosea]MBK1827984.1 prolipoprotein diacylglyceryl transferase [Haloferula rosea]